MKTFTIIEKFGGRKKVASMLSTQRRVITTDVVRMWCARGRIPGYAVKALLQHAEKKDITVSAKDFDPCVVTNSSEAA